MFWVKRLDKSEKVIFIWFMITFTLDLLSTLFAVIAGYGDREMNIAIYHMGWFWGGLIAFALNFVVLWIFLKALQAHRSKPVHHRFSTVAMLTVFLLLRTLVVVSNVYLGLQPITEPVVKPDVAEVAYSWLTIVIPCLVVWVISRIIFWIFRKSYDIKYIGEAPVTVK